MKDTDLYRQILGLVSPWVVKSVSLDKPNRCVTVEVELTGRVAYKCPECDSTVPGYDSVPRKWRHLDTMQFQTVLYTNLPRMQCPEHGIITLEPPWAIKGSRFTALFENLVIDLLHCCSKEEAAGFLKMSWKQVDGIMKRAVERGLVKRNLEEELLGPIGIDEKAFKKGHKYVTIVSDLQKDQARVLFVEPERKAESLNFFYKEILSEAQRDSITAVAMDMWAPYAKSTRENIEDADRKIVYDKFHVISHMNKAINEVRQTENRALLRIGDRRLVKSKWTWLKNEENMKNSERNTFNELRKTKLKTARARALGDMLKGLWGQLNIESARAYFEKWYSWAKRCRIEPIKKVAEMVKSHLHEILNYHLHRITNARAEGLNSKIGWIIYTARGFRSMHNFIIAVYFHCGCLQLYPR